MLFGKPFERPVVLASCCFHGARCVLPSLLLEFGADRGHDHSVHCKDRLILMPLDWR